MSLSQIKPAFGRTIDALRSDTPAIEAIERSIGGRLAAVADLLPLAAEHCRVEAKPVHRLRVATRRAGAAIDLFEPLLPASRTRALRRSLKKVRRAAADARDADVAMLSMRDRFEALRSTPADAEALSLAFGVTSCERDAAAERLVERCLSIGPKLSRRADRLLRSSRDRSHKDAPFFPVALAALDAQIQRCRDAAADDLTEPPPLHALRIECKRLRYTIEAVGAVADEQNLGDLYAALVESQDRFGAVNDASQLGASLERLAERLKQSAIPPGDKLLAGLAELAERQSHAARTTHEEFLNWWPGSPLRRLLARGIPAPIIDKNQHTAAEHPGGEDRA